MLVKKLFGNYRHYCHYCHNCPYHHYFLIGKYEGRFYLPFDTLKVTFFLYSKGHFFTNMTDQQL